MSTSFLDGIPPPPNSKPCLPWLETLSPEQAYLCSAPGPLLVLAGAGTGKTHTLTARILHLLHCGIAARRILVVTFTRHAALDMDARLRQSLGAHAPLPRTDTLHLIALALWHKARNTPILLTPELAHSTFDAVNADSPAVRQGAWHNISQARERMTALSPQYAEMLHRYAQHKTACNLADYTDLLEFWYKQVTNKTFNSPWEHILLDEVQDLSPLQLALVRSLLSSEEGFFATGDPAQSIASLYDIPEQRLAYLQNLWPTLRRMPLTHSYRCPQKIAYAAQSVLYTGTPSGAATEAAGLHNTQSTPASPALSSSLQPAPTAENPHPFACPPVLSYPQKSGAVYSFSGECAKTEAAWIVKCIQYLTAPPTPAGILASPAGIPYAVGDIAIFIRTRDLAYPLRDAIVQAGISATFPTGDFFGNDPRVTLILNMAKRLLGIPIPYSAAEHAIPPCPDTVFTKGPLGLAAYFSEISPFDSLFWHTEAFKALAKAFTAHGGWTGLLTWMHLQNEWEYMQSQTEAVQLIPMSAAKGLEFPIVFLPCLEDGIVPFIGPHMLAGKSKAYQYNIPEEQRLLHVAMSRGTDALFLSHAKRRTLHKHELRLKPSRFLNIV